MKRNSKSSVGLSDFASTPNAHTLLYSSILIGGSPPLVWEMPEVLRIFLMDSLELVRTFDAWVLSLPDFLRDRLGEINRKLRSRLKSNQLDEETFCQDFWVLLQEKNTPKGAQAYKKFIDENFWLEGFFDANHELLVELAQHYHHCLPDLKSQVESIKPMANR